MEKKIYDILIDKIHLSLIQNKDTNKLINQLLEIQIEGIENIDEITYIYNIKDHSRKYLNNRENKKNLLKSIGQYYTNKSKGIIKIVFLILLVILIEFYLFVIVQTQKSAIMGVILLFITVIGLFVYLYFFTDKFKKSNKYITKIDKKNSINIQNIEILNKNNAIINFKTQIIKIIIGIIYLLISYYIVIGMIAEHGFNGLMLLFMPQLWGIIIGPILIINGIYNLIFYSIIKKNIYSKNKIISIKNIIGLIFLSIIPMFYFISGLKMVFSNNLFGGIYNLPFISGGIIIFIGFKIKENFLKLKNNNGKENIIT